MEPTTGVIVKSDQTGRTRYTPEYKREVASSANGPALEVQLPCGSVARASDTEQIRLLAALPRHLA